MSCDKYSVLYTHQKTKKAKTWQDGFLRVTGSKAVLCDEVSKTLDSLFVRKDQLAQGEELESDRYLITIEEKLNPSSDHTHEVTLKAQEKQVEHSAGPLYQSGKRKRRCFQPPAVNQKKPMVIGFTDPEAKKLREETIPRHGRLGMANRRPSKTDFFNVYSSHSSKQKDNSSQVSQRKEPNGDSLAVLQTTNKSYAAGKQWDERHDQRVHFNMAQTYSAAGKENGRFHVPKEGPFSSKFVFQKERSSATENKRSTSQILALFSSYKNKPPSKMMPDEQTVEINEANSGVMKETQLCNLYDTSDKFSSKIDAAKVIAQTTNVSEIANAFQSSILDNDAFGRVLETVEDLGDSLNLSPDSFAACSSENFGCNVHEGDAMCEDATQESAFTKSPDNNQRQSKVWSQSDSESVSPLIRLLTSVEKDDPQGCIDVKEDGKQLCINTVKENNLLDHHSFESPDSASLGSPPSLLDPPSSPNVHSTHQSSYGIQKGSLEEASSSSFVQVGSRSERNMSSCRPDIIPPLITTKDGISTSCENMLLSPPKLDPFRTNTKGFSGHPGCLFPYRKLQSQDQNNHLRNSSDSSLFRKDFGDFDQWDSSFEHQAFGDGEGNFQQYEMSPEFYPSQSDKTSDWRVAPIVATKVIPTDSRTVTAGDGHSWKGSVVSDTVKRGCSSIPMVSVHRQDVHCQPSNGDQRAPSSSLTWVDSISSSEIHYDSPCLLSTQGFATSESIALSFTEGFMENGQAREGNPTDIRPDFVQRVPQLPRRRSPLLTAPPEDLSTQQIVSRNPIVYHGLPTASCSTEFLEFSSKPKAMVITGEGKIGPLQGETSQLHEANVGNLRHERHDTGPSTSRSPCRRVGLRRIGLACTRDLHNGQNTMSQTGPQFRKKSNGYRLPSAPEFLSNSSSGDRSMAGELSVPSAEECDSSVTPTRHVTVPVTFSDVMQYRQVFKSALREHLNIVLFELARTYHVALQKVDVSGFGAHNQGIRQSSDGPCCPHGQARLRAVKKDGPNKGRLFYTCPGMGQEQCKFFKWADEYQTNKSVSKGAEHKSSNKLTLSSSEGLMSFFRSHNVAFYCECHLVRKNSDSGKGKFGTAKAKKWGKQRGFDAEAAKKGLYLELSRKDHSSTYSKDDIWIISKTFSFNPDSTFIASSAYYGPSSCGELEIHPISGYSPSNWQSGEIVHALMAYNAGTELTCISNIEDHVKMQNMPVLPYILRRSQTEESNARSASRASSFVPPTLRTSGGQLDLPLEVTEGLAEEMIARFSLNKDQAVALLSCASMFSSSAADSCSSLPVCLIHGVFGAGKSFLLAVVVLYLVELFKASDALNQQSNTSSSWKILVSSTTNVAVDRILLGLLELGFEEFVRVGSIRKIAKPVLPYSVHSTGSDSQELKELQSLLKTELTPSERNHVRKGIEQHKLGENKRKLSQVRVVGVTCAACVFPCLDKLKFPVLLLDECSQMTEPASLLPMARFECRKLVLVGDPKQLSPTIQGSEPDHEAGLEQTMFDRLIKMGYEPTMLRTQYRCHPAISAISNRLFYDNKLLDGVTAEDRTPLVDLVPTLCFYNVGKGKEKCGRDGSYYNEEEAKFVVFLIECLLESGVEPAQIGVITLYKSQLQTISNNLAASRATSHAELKAIQISTVDAFQGGEKDLIILSCVRTDHIGFIDCDRRTNVALTRAKRHLLIVGNLKMLSCNTVWGKVIEHCQGFPDGLCHSQDLMKKWNQENNDINEGPVSKEICLQDTVGCASQTTNGKEQNLAPCIPKYPYHPSLNEETANGERQCTKDDSRVSALDGTTQPLSFHLPCTDILDVDTTVQDDSDDELPTFDVFSSLGIEPV